MQEKANIVYSKPVLFYSSHFCFIKNLWGEIVFLCAIFIADLEAMNADS